VTRQLLTGNAAVAWGARLADVDYVPSFPITPQTEIIETLARWIGKGELDAKWAELESEHSMMTAAGAAAATGVRVFTATSSQGLLYAAEMLYSVAGWRVPLVLANVSRAVASPLTLEPDHNDVLAMRDSGFLALHSATCQEALDLTLLAFRIAEDPRVRLPALVNLDGFHLSFTREPVEVPDIETVRAFLPAFDGGDLRFRASAPMSQGVAVLASGAYSYFRYEEHLASERALVAFEEAARSFAAATGRSYELVEQYRTDDADVVFFMIGSFSTKAKEAVERLRQSGMRVGLVRPRLLRPFPSEAIARALAGKRAAAIVDQNLSVGFGGVLHSEVATALYGRPGAPVLACFIAGLGGRDISLEDFCEMARVAERAALSGEPPPTRLVFSRAELAELRKFQSIAGATSGGPGVPPGRITVGAGGRGCEGASG
jgi:pyruvate ferredoxin oxidoreductase alpha subunit